MLLREHRNGGMEWLMNSIPTTNGLEAGSLVPLSLWNY
jgi:hypothetical protein